MVDEIPQGIAEPQSAPGMGEPQSLTPGGVPDTQHGEQPPMTAARPAEDPRDAAFRKGYTEARERLFSELGADYDPDGGRKAYTDALAALRARMAGEQKGTVKAKPVEPPHDGEEPQDEYHRLAAQLQDENAQLRQQIEAAEKDREVYSARDMQALRTEVRQMLREAGAHADGLDDFVDLMVPDPSGPRMFVRRGADGVTPELWERSPDGNEMPSRLGLREYVAKQAELRSWMFAAGALPGAGTTPPQSRPSPKGQSLLRNGYDFHQRAKEIAERRRR